MFTTHFFGNEISDYGKENGHVDYATLAKSFDSVFAGGLMAKTNIEDWEIENGSYSYYEDNDGNQYTEAEKDNKIEELENEISAIEAEDDNEDNEELENLREQLESLENSSEYYYDIFQFFIISEQGARILKEFTDEIVLYNSDFNLYVWGITHYGTSWDYVLTDIKCTGKESK